MASFWKAALLPPAYGEKLSTAQWATVAKMRIAFIGLAILTDVMILLLLNGRARIDQDVLWFFAEANIGILSMAFLASVGMLRLPAFRRNWIAAVSASGEALTIIIWVQATGTLSSYFVLIGILIAVWYRIYFGYWVALVTVLTLAVAHLGAIGLEEAGLLKVEALFLGPPSRVYTVEAYRWIAMMSIAWCYVLCIVGSNVVVNRVREKDRALAEVRREAARAAEEVKHGRLTGTLLDEEYALGELLGRGGMGEIYMARRVSTDATVAVKVLHGHLVAEDTIVERFRRESEVAKAIPARHTAEIQAFGHDAARHIHYIAMEYLRGEDLGAYLRRRGVLPLEDLIPLARAIAVALDAAHAVGVVHRDLKPQNVFLIQEAGRTGAGGFQVRLLDFGMSKLVDVKEKTLTQMNAIIGTIGYMAPEQALGRIADIGVASDVFAFAAIVYRALTGRLPFQAGDVLAAIREVAHVHPPPPSSLQPRLHRDVDAVLAIGLAKGLDDRYPTASALVDDLEEAAEGRLSEEVRVRAHSIHSGVGEAATLTAEGTKA